MSIGGGVSVIIGSMHKIIMHAPVYIDNMQFVSVSRSTVETTPDSVWAVYRHRWKGKEAILLSEEFPSKPELPSNFDIELNNCIPSSFENYEALRLNTRKFALTVLSIIHCDRDHQLKEIKKRGISQLLALPSYEIDGLKLPSAVLFGLLSFWFLYIICKIWIYIYI